MRSQRAVSQTVRLRQVRLGPQTETSNLAGITRQLALMPCQTYSLTCYQVRGLKRTRGGRDARGPGVASGVTTASPRRTQTDMHRHADTHTRTGTGAQRVQTENPCGRRESFGGCRYKPGGRTKCNTRPTNSKIVRPRRTVRGAWRGFWCRRLADMASTAGQRQQERTGPGFRP